MPLYTTTVVPERVISSCNDGKLHRRDIAAMMMAEHFVQAAQAIIRLVVVVNIVVKVFQCKSLLVLVVVLSASRKEYGPELVQSSKCKTTSMLIDLTVNLDSVEHNTSSMAFSRVYVCVVLVSGMIGKALTLRSKQRFRGRIYVRMYA